MELLCCVRGVGWFLRPFFFFAEPKETSNQTCYRHHTLAIEVMTVANYEVMAYYRKNQAREHLRAKIKSFTFI